MEVNEAMVVKAERISRFEVQMMEELRAQWICVALVFLPLVVASSLHIGGNE